ncbi:MAG: hypothetical protein IBX72_16110 [Nitrospirae bacterium]|nr:hypothetical protein [Nitrospirota bacterium]
MPFQKVRDLAKPCFSFLFCKAKDKLGGAKASACLWHELAWSEASRSDREA